MVDHNLHYYPADSKDELSYRTKAREICDRLIRPNAIRDDELSHYRKEAYVELGRAGLLACFAPRHFGGNESSFTCHYTVIEEISRASLSMTVVVGVNNLVQGALCSFGSDDQKNRYLTKLVRGEWLGAFSLSEAQSGSDAASLRTCARKTEGGYRLTGNKLWCSNAGHADLYLVMTRTNDAGSKGITAFLVEKTAPGFCVGKQEKKLGLRGSTLAELVFEDCFVPIEQRLGEEGEGYQIALSQLDAGRITIGVGGLGTTIETLARVWELQRKQASPAPGLRETFAGYFAETQALKLLVRLAAEMRDKKARITAIGSQLKLLGSELSVKVTSDAISFAGTNGYLKKTGLERLLRDAKALPIVEGTNQIQRLVLGREMDRMYEAVVSA